MEFVAADVEALHLGGGDFDALLVGSRVEGARDLEAGFGRGRGDQLDHGDAIGEGSGAPVLGDVTEQAMLDFVPFRRARRIVANLDREPGLGLRRLPRLPLAPVLPGALSAAPQSDRLDRGPQAPHHVGLPQGRDMNVRLYVWQRLTAALMVPLVLAHVAVIFYASRKGMTAADILARTRGSIAWASFYGVFVVAAAIHAAIGVRNVLTEWSPLKDRGAGIFASAFGALLLLLGARAGVAVVLPW